MSKLEGFDTKKMSCSIKMYRTTQIVKHDLPVKLPKCMYTLKNIHSRDTKGMVAESTDHVSTLNKNSSIFDQVKQFLKVLYSSIDILVFKDFFNPLFAS